VPDAWAAKEVLVEIDPRSMPPLAVYKLLIGCVVPRPIAWVSTVSADGVNNVAPFSFFMGVCNDPPTLAFSVGPRGGDAKAGPAGQKDTVRNLEATGDFVVNVVDDTLAEQMNLTSGEYPPDVDEFVLAGLTAAPGVKVRAPRVLEAPISMECHLAQIVRVGRGPHSLVLGEIVHFHIRDDLYDPRAGRIDMHRLKPVGRLAGQLYTRVHDIFEMKRPNANYAG
jgi:flavin reductase (DIM6/NTAB) family NADH-FMN oxidoreductase RutF